MKNLFKRSFITLAISASLAACTGNATKPAADSAKDTSVMNPAGTNADTVTGVAGANGAPAAIDSGMDHSGSGGTDTVKKNQ